MKSVVLTFALVAVTASVNADDQWVSVGAARAVAPATQNTPTDSSDRATVKAPANITPATAPAASSGLLSEMAMQMEQMQMEIAELRGRVEEQDHLIRRLTQDQQERYLDLDRRMAALLAGGTPAAVVAPVAVKESPAEAYKNAMTLVREKKFAEANVAFSDFVKNYPQDPLVGNALYWSGEVYLVQSDLDKALESFRKVVTQHPDHDKAADATYKMGITLHKKGDVAQAKVWLQKVIDLYTGKADGTVRLAKSYLAKLS
jgi:tol-pal system protein YbgF